MGVAEPCRLVPLPPCAQSALERKNWKRFGNAADQEFGITMQSKEDIPFEKTRVKQKTDQEKKTADLQSALATSDKSLIVGSLRDMLYKRRMERAMLAARGMGPEPEKPPGEDVRALPFPLPLSPPPVVPLL